MCQMNDDKMIRYTITDAVKSLWDIDKIKHWEKRLTIPWLILGIIRKYAQ
jgi:hypothetical protein